MKLSRIAEQLLKHEGMVNHAYQDHLGYWTIGVGRLIDKRRGGGISEEEAMVLLNNDIARVIARLNSESGFCNFPEQVQEALINMGFQLGVNGLLNFKNMWKALREHDWDRAAEEALDSRWAMQTPRRASEIAKMIREAE